MHERVKPLGDRCRVDFPGNAMVAEREAPCAGGSSNVGPVAGCLKEHGCAGHSVNGTKNQHGLPHGFHVGRPQARMPTGTSHDAERRSTRAMAH